jgi:hypothetical protein
MDVIREIFEESFDGDVLEALALSANGTQLNGRPLKPDMGQYPEQRGSTPSATHTFEFGHALRHCFNLQ